MATIRCPICGGAQDQSEKTCRSRPYTGKTLQLRHCPACGFSQLEDNRECINSLFNKGELDDERRSQRNANAERPGREFHMATLGVELLGRVPPAITFFGAGTNTDHRWVANRYPGIKSKRVDLYNVQHHPDYEPIESASTSSLVIACEVIEHFADPVRHFESLFRIVADDGLLICSTNVNDGSDIETHNYPFIPGHTAYWSPLSLLSMGGRHGFLVDFRAPEVCFSKDWPRKRYVLFFKRTEILLSIAEYFGRHRAAPSE